MAIGIFLILGMVLIFSSMKNSYRFQEGMTRVQENGRIAIEVIAHQVRMAGHRRPVWDDPQSGFYPITGATVDGGGGANDTLQLMYQDDLDCFGVSNGATNNPETNLPVTWYKRVTFSVNGNDQLTWNCEYGASTGALATQINAEAIIDGVDSFQLEYGVDTDVPPDFGINSWAIASAINPKTTICLQSRFLCDSEAGLVGAMASGVPLSIQIGLLLRSPASVAGTDTVAFTVLDQAVAAANDNLYRQLFTTTVSLRNVTL